MDKKRGAIGYKYPVHCFFFCCVHVFRLSRIQRLRQDFCFIIFKRDLLFSILVGSFVGFPIHADCRPIRKQQGKEPMASVPLLPHSAVFFFFPISPSAFVLRVGYRSVARFSWWPSSLTTGAITSVHPDLSRAHSPIFLHTPHFSFFASTFASPARSSVPHRTSTGHYPNFFLIFGVCIIFFFFSCRPRDMISKIACVS